MESKRMTASFELVGELPESDKPWSMAKCAAGIVFSNPDHPLFLYTNDGEWETITPEPPTEIKQ